MLSCCANSACRKPLHYLREGKIFLFSVRKPQEPEDRSIPRLEHFWLCGTCSREWTLAMDGKDSVQLVALRKRRDRVYSVTEAAPAC
jgi:hypothetical protein